MVRKYGLAIDNLLAAQVVTAPEPPRPTVASNFAVSGARWRELAPMPLRSPTAPGTYARLAGIKRQYDPENLFRFNQNLPPRL